ncbi:anti-sigma H sporulation factor, LonB [Deinococcus proteolyticus MRP]|uniref:Lon protease n=1 Tax=Deinococcus proteolyticus (strain ATCC 35074 / DSM 20540 / JCM 6276 / NBRC 101906 / NCIMB 13154 / VKM Ac-1939 / CCM 2703 / MRP) TaxID=693977 RepID=F0RJ31_DEIPM|nr:endopeptidase La [Deinococcus sp. SL84]ADY25439.1 anti-sigma H sporulation factor, LonB [Deinococcus proteolyticus MRP]
MPQSSSSRIPRLVPVCPVRGSVIYPGMVQHIDASRAISISAIEAAMEGEKYILIVSQLDKDVDDPKAKDLYDFGTVCQILRVRKNPDGSLQLLVSAQERAAVKAFTWSDEGGYFTAALRMPRATAGEAKEEQALRRELLGKFDEVAGAGRISSEAQQVAHAKDDLGELTDHIAFHMDFKLEDKQALLELTDIPARARRVLSLLDTEQEVQEVQAKIRAQVKEEIDKNQREYFLREQLKAIQKELQGGGEDGEELDEAEAFRAKIDELGLRPEVKKEVDREIGRLSRMHPDAAEAGVIRTYLTWVTELPWNKRSEDNLDIERAAQVLDEDHYGLEKVKDRVLEFLAVRQLRKARAERGEISAEEVNKGPILVFTGPPGVGKTSIAQSIAKALGREYVRIALGGARDESDIRGHRRTYIGSMPGRIIQGLRSAGTKNPVVLLDEIDKLGTSYQGDPSSALLEVLDPAQNQHFTDHYLGVPLDLSEVMFIATANYPDQIPEALMDRMEVIEFSSYIEQEKLEIAKRYLVPRQLDQNGLKKNQITVTDPALEKLISNYTREAGVRNLEREIGTVARKVARRIALGDIKRARVTDAELERYLGKPRHTPESEAPQDMVGVSTGMFYTPVGGDILFVETSIMPGKGGLVLTGQLGDVMKESARAALTYAKTNAERFHIDKARLDDSEIHIHVPAGAIPKEGPSAGGAITTSLVSALTGVPARRDTAMTGEMTLTGRYLPIGGLKEKVLGARRAGIKNIILPAANEPDIADIPAHLRASMQFHPCTTLDEVLDHALVGGLKALEGESVSGSSAPAPKKGSKGRSRKSEANA